MSSSCTVVNDDPNDAHSALRKEVAAAFQDVTDLVETVSRLPLPAHVTIRLATPGQFVTINKRLARHTLRSIKTRSVRHAILLGVARLAVGYVIGRDMQKEWQDHAGQTYITASGDQEILLIPEALAGMKLSPTTLRAVLAHELAHAAQNVRYPENDRHFMERSLTPERAEDRVDIRALREGHAVWVCARVTERLYGSAITELHDGDVMRPEHRRGLRFVEYVVAGQGVARVNDALSSIEAMPTADEIDDPERWLKRVAGP